MATLIDIRMPSVKTNTKNMLDFASATKQAHAAVQQLQSSAGMGTGLPGGGRRVSGSGGSGGSSSAGPAQNYANAVARVNSAMAQGTLTFDDQYKLLQASNRLQRANNAMNKSSMGATGKAVSSLIYSTRIGAGADGLSAMPLIGKMVSTIGALAVEAPEAAAALAVLAVALSGVILAAQAAKYGVDFAQAQIAGGGSATQTSQLIGLGTAMGMGPGAMTGAAHGMNSWMAGNPYAASVGQRGGFGPNYMGSFGDTNDTARLLKAIESMMRMSDKDAQKFALGGPLEQMLWLKRVDPGTLKGAEDASSAMQSPDNQKKAATATVEFNTAMTKLQLILIDIGTKTLPMVIEGLDAMALDLDYFEAGIMSVQKVLSLIPGLGIDAPTDKDWSDIEAQIDAHRKRVKGVDATGVDHSSSAQLTDAVNRNTDAINNNSKQLTQNQQTYGGAGYAKGGVPNRWFAPNSPYADAAHAHISQGQMPG